MNKIGESKNGSCIKTRIFVDANNAIWNADQSFSDDFALFKALLAEVAIQSPKADAVITGYTIDKSNKEDLVIKDILYISSRIQTWAIRPAINRPDVYQAAAVTITSLLRLKDTELAPKARTIFDLIDANPGIEPTYVSLARKTAFNTNINNFDAVVQMPQVKIDERAAATKLMYDKLNEAFNFRKKALAVSAKEFMDPNPNFYNGFKNTLKLDNNPVTKLALKGEVKDKVTGLGISKLTVTIPALNKSVKTGTKGNYIFKSLPPGEYTMVFKMYGYLTVDKTVYINDGARADINVVMIPKTSLPTTLTIRTFIADDQSPLGSVSLTQLDGAGMGQTNASGSLKINNIGPGPLSLKASKPGYVSVEREIEIIEHEENVLDIYLNQQ